MDDQTCQTFWAEVQKTIHAGMSPKITEKQFKQIKPARVRRFFRFLYGEFYVPLLSVEDIQHLAISFFEKEHQKKYWNEED